MALICFASQKGSPGVTLTALTVAAAWPSTPGRRKLLLEADADGGSLAIRYQLGRQPGLLSLAAASRHGLGREDLLSHAQELPGGLAAVVAPERADRAAAVLSTSGGALGAWLAALPDVDVIVDCGRLHGASPALTLAGHADAVFFVSRPVAEQIQPAVERLKSLGGNVETIGWVLIGERPYSAAEVSAATGIPVAAVLADDPRTAHALTNGECSQRVRRSSLVRTASAFAARLAAAAARPAELEIERTPTIVHQAPVAPLVEATR